jgi:hypothetical protein
MSDDLIELTKKSVEHYKNIGLVREPITPDYSNFPCAGDKLKFRGVPSMYYPMFTNVGKFANENLKNGQEYIVSRVEVNSSWCAVWLDGFGENFFHYQFFYPKTPCLS